MKVFATDTARTANANIGYLKEFARTILDVDREFTLRRISERITPKEIDAFFDVFTVEFGKWLLQRAPRTLEHTVEELLEMFRDELSVGTDEIQVSYQDYNDTIKPNPTV